MNHDHLLPLQAVPVDRTPSYAPNSASEGAEASFPLFPIPFEGAEASFPLFPIPFEGE